MEQVLFDKVVEKFVEIFQTEPLVFSSPGRINLIGEHTDYNNGFVLPAAIDKAIFMAIGVRSDEEIHLHSIDFEDSYLISINEISPLMGWPTYILGVVDQLKQNGFSLGGFNAVIHGDIPIGAGLSSSAALECVSIYALNELFKLGIDKIAMAKMAQKAEHEYAGVKCGIMDQFASMMGKKDHVIKLDCESMEYEYFPLQLDGYKVVLMDTQVKHELASSEYNTRRTECNRGVDIIRQKYPDVQSLRDVSIDIINELLDPATKVFQRCKFVVEEIKRLQDACVLLDKNNLIGFGKKMFETHDGLSKLYEVSCKELDFIANACKMEHAVIGARMMGGGFGGCVIALIKEEKIEEITTRIGTEYKNIYGIEMKIYITKIKEGTSRISHEQYAGI